MDEIFSVDELAMKANVTARTVRLYVERGLLTPMRAGRTLCFTFNDIDMLNAILRAKRLGFSLDDIKRHGDNPTRATLNERLHRVQKIKADAEQELAALAHQLNKQEPRS